MEGREDIHPCKVSTHATNQPIPFATRERDHTCLPRSSALWNHGHLTFTRTLRLALSCRTDCCVGSTYGAIASAAERSATVAISVNASVVMELQCALPWSFALRNWKHQAVAGAMARPRDPAMSRSAFIVCGLACNADGQEVSACV